MAGPSTRLHVRVSPGAARAGVVGRLGEAWKVRVSAAPEQGRANLAVLELLSETLDVPRDRLELLTGQGENLSVIMKAGAFHKNRLAA